LTKFTGIKLGLMLALGAWQGSAQAVIYSASLEDSNWQVSASQLECRLEHAIPGYGKGVFSRKAGEGLSFHLRPIHRVLPEGEVRLSVEAPNWKPYVQPQQITRLRTEYGLNSVEAPEPIARQMLVALQQGLKAAVTADAVSDLQFVKVAVSSVNFLEPYGSYNQCLAQLLPVSFEQIARSAIYFDLNQSRLSPQVQEQLDLIARFIKADKTVRRVYIDGHTDDQGPKKVNKTVSKRRAQVIVSYLKKQGVSKKKLVMRYHGDKYPVVKNENEENRARNRRVTLRLSR